MCTTTFFALPDFGSLFVLLHGMEKKIMIFMVATCHTKMKIIQLASHSIKLL